MIGSMAPKPKVSKETVINAWFELLRQREQKGMKNPERGLHSQVGKMYGFEGQYVGRIIKAYRKQMAKDGGIEPKTEPIEPITPPFVRFETTEPIEPIKSETRKTCRSDLGPDEWAEKSREAREKFAEAVKGEELVPEETEPSGGGGSWLSRLNDAGGIKQLQKENRKLEGRIGRLEDQLAGLEVARRPGLRGSPKSSPRQEQVLDMLSDGKEYSFRQVEKALKCSDAAVRNSVKALREKGKVKVRKVKGKGRVKLDKSVQDLL